LLHGFSDNGLCWMPLAQDLEADYDVIMPDARGHGLSDRVVIGQEIDGAGDAAGLIQTLGLQKPVVGGHSMGGIIATEFGARYPDLARGLFLEDPAWIDPNPGDPPMKRNPIFEWLLHIDELTLEEIEAKGRAENPTWPEIEMPPWTESKRQLDKHIFEVVNVRKPWRQFVAAFQVPALLITADVERGAIVSSERAQEAAGLSPSLQIAAVQDAGHNIRRENYPAFMAALRTFLKLLN
jgi:pimeloyl-ACP methyl ester carboxylesterase